MAEQNAHKWLILVAVGSALLMGTVDGSIVNVALPSLTTDLHTHFYLVQWAVLSFLMGLAVCLLAAGRLGDMIGKKRVFTAGLIVFVLSSTLCGLSPGIHWLIAFRFMQAVGASMIVALGVAIVTETWPRTEHGTAIGISAGIISLGAVAGPALGGFILHVLSWRWIFFVNVPIGLLSLVLVRIYVPDLQPKNRNERFDVIGAMSHRPDNAGLCSRDDIHADSRLILHTGRLSIDFVCSLFNRIYLDREACGASHAGPFAIS